MITVRDLLMTKSGDIWSVTPDTSVLDALKLLAEKDIGALVVLKDGKISGIVSERDFVRSLARTGKCLLESPVSHYMVKEVFTVSPTETIDQCMQTMTEKHIRHLPVLEHDRLVGVISIGDVVREMITHKQLTIEQLQDYIMGRTFSG